MDRLPFWMGIDSIHNRRLAGNSPTAPGTCSDANRDATAWRTLISMRECLSCQKPIPDSRRKNAMYCERPACRAREYRRRRREAEKLRASTQGPAHPVHIEQDSLVITCSCGNRLRIHVSHLGHAAPTHEADLAAAAQPADPASNAVDGPTDINESGAMESAAPDRVSVTANGTQQEPEADGTSNPGQSDQMLDSSPALPLSTMAATATPSSSLPDVPVTPIELNPAIASGVAALPAVEATPPIGAFEAPEPPSRSPTMDALATPSSTQEPSASGKPSHSVASIARSPSSPDAGDAVSTDPAGFRTCELFGILYGRVVTLSELPTVQSYGGRTGFIRGAELHATIHASRGFGLAGIPGRWRGFYPHQRPTRFGLDADLAVLFWDPRTRCGSVADAELLTKLLGRGWREQLRQISE